MADAQLTSIPKVPLRTEMFPDAKVNADGSIDLGRLDRTWILFFERIPKGNTNSGGGGGTPGTETFQRTLLLKDTTVGNNIADEVSVYAVNSGTTGGVTQVIGILRKTISADLTVRLKVIASGTPTTIGTFTIPHTTAVATPVLFTTFSSTLIPLDGVFQWDVTASDGSMDGAGVASFTVLWQ